MSLTFHSVLSKLYAEASIGVSYQISVHLAKWFQRRFFRKQPTQKQEWPVVAMSPSFYSVLSKLYAEASIGVSYQISVHLAKRSEENNF